MNTFIFQNNTKEDLLKLLFDKDLLKDIMACNYCSEDMEIRESNDNPEKYHWRCFMIRYVK